MKAILSDFGNPNKVNSITRTNAIAGAKALCDMMADNDFADLFSITLDWEGYDRTGKKPIVEMTVVKWNPKWAPSNLQIFWPVDMTEVFGLDNATREDLQSMVDYMKGEIETKVALRERLN